MGLANLESDRQRFTEIVKQKVRQDLKKLFTSSGFWGRPGSGKPIKVKITDIEIPHIVYGQNLEGVGQGEGKEGEIIGEDPPEGPMDGGGGSSPGEHHLEIEFSEEEMMDILIQGLELPRLQPKGKKTIPMPVGKYTGVRPVGPDSLLIRKRSYKRALKRTLSSGEYSPEDPKIVIEKDDKRHRAQKNAEIPFAEAVLILLRDISGSMGDDFNKVVHTVSKLFDIWVHHHYKGHVQVRYFAHDTELLPEMTQEEFYRMSWGGGTLFAPAYKGITDIIDRDHPPALWNVYFCHFTDGANFGGDVEAAKATLNELIPRTNLSAVAEVGPEEMTWDWWGTSYTWKKEPANYFGGKVEEFVQLHAPLFKLVYVKGPEDAYDAFVQILK